MSRRPELGDASRAPESRVCGWCASPLPRATRADALFCSKRCRQSSWRFGRPLSVGDGAGRHASWGSPRRFAYADPPYPGMSARYYATHADFGGEVDHAALVERLCDEFPDGWALSTSSKTLRVVLALCPADVRIGAWTKPAPPTVSRAPRVSWEPVIFYGGRPAGAEDGARLDWVHAAPMRAYPGAVVGTKPPAFCYWLFASLGAGATDELCDLFPGSGAVSRAWEMWRARPRDGSDASSASARRATAVPVAQGLERHVSRRARATVQPVVRLAETFGRLDELVDVSLSWAGR